ncbi:phosphoribosylformylglycinamidine synthase subunit PurQ [bacterium]|nr:phosphoribosylformylglycinamidine synthase subunit PurQ [bacterium]
MNVAVVLYPGMNCENESVRALQSVGLSAEIVRSNEPASRLDPFDGFLLPGGFSYEDRIRAGVVAAGAPITEAVIRAAEAGKPVAGICNGAQVLLECGLVPGIESGRVEMALALNDSGGRVGYTCDWRWVTGSLFEEPIPLPFAHAEGRFTTGDESVRKEVLRRDLIVARYCDEEGRVGTGWPVNPNGAWESAAALRGASGHVLAIMPHPERANWAWQVPDGIGGRWGTVKRGDGGAFRDVPGPGRQFFRAFADTLKGALA